MFTKIKNFFFSSKKENQLSLKELFIHFQKLIYANNRALELMSEMGEVLSGEYIFDRKFIRDSTRELLDNVYQMIVHLDAIAPNKYQELFERFDEIKRALVEELKGNIYIPDYNYTIFYEDIEEGMEDIVGGKNAVLAVLQNVLELKVPKGFVITTQGFKYFLQASKHSEEIQNVLSQWKARKISTDQASRTIQDFILHTDFTHDFEAEVKDAVVAFKKKLKVKSVYFAVRSSCVGEDSEHSFAGLYDSFLGVPDTELLTAYKKVLASTYSRRAMTYRREKSYGEREIAMAIGCQLVINPKVSGVVFTLDVNKKFSDNLMIAAIPGLAVDVVDGRREGDVFYVQRSAPHEIYLSKIGVKNRTTVFDYTQGKLVEVKLPPEKAKAPCLSPEQVKLLSSVAMQIERYFKHPQDIEFCFDQKDQLIILQSRPLNILDLKLHCNLDQVKDKAKILLANQGDIVQQGIAYGQVLKLKGDEEVGLQPEELSDKILVVQYPSPRLARVIKYVRGIIADRGAPVGHLATIAREFRVPMIVNTRIATQVLNTGDEITLNAIDNEVYQGIFKQMCYYDFVDKFEETREYRTLRRIFREVSPLNLIEGSDKNFKAANCKTLHDIIRFIHEKAVQELIEQNYYAKISGESSAKKLKCSIPLDLIVIDLEQEFLERDEYVELEQVSSEPLKNFIQGASYSDLWSRDPVGVDFRGFMSSLSRTFSPHLADPKFVGQNLAVVSSNYANISLRLGYHFTMLDTLVTQKPADNYIYFRFFGGVTEEERRSRRAKLIEKILLQNDFMTVVKGDLVIGRVKGMRKSYVLDKIFILGMLVAYTRQLDVKMTEEQSIDYFLNDFRQIVLGCARLSSKQEEEYVRTKA